MNGKPTAGFSLLELLAVLVLLGLLASHAGLRFGFGGATLPAQADQLAADLRHAQGLAMQLARRLRLETTGGGYRVVDVAASAPITDPATQQPFTVALENGVTLAGGPVTFDSLGRPVDAGGLAATAVDFVLAADGRSRTVRVRPVSGLAEVVP